MSNRLVALEQKQNLKWHGVTSYHSVELLRNINASRVFKMLSENAWRERLRNICWILSLIDVGDIHEWGDCWCGWFWCKICFGCLLGWLRLILSLETGNYLWTIPVSLLFVDPSKVQLWSIMLKWNKMFILLMIIREFKIYETNSWSDYLLKIWLNDDMKKKLL